MPLQSINLNPGWRFHRGDVPAAIEPSFDDSAWQRVNLPHCFDLPYFRTPEFYVGPGWYRRLLRVPRDHPHGGRAVLEFEGAFQQADVFLNGHHVGSHAGGYTSFAVDLTDHLHEGESNVLAVRVDSSWNPRLAPRAGEHHFSGGLYRDVRLLLVEPLHIAWRGVAIETPIVSHDSARVVVHTAVNDDAYDDRGFRLVTDIVGPHGNVIDTRETHDSVQEEDSLDVTQEFDLAGELHLWSPERPSLYIARQSLYDCTTGTLADRSETPFGLRWFQWTPDRGFFLNGSHYYLRGANAHQDHAGWGIGITQGAIERDVRLMKEAGFNFIRGAHYPHHRAFAQACDRLGMICLVENCFWGKGGFGPEGYWNASAYPTDPNDYEGFETSCRVALREMIRDNRNSPSIVAWSMTNEAFFTYNLDRARSLIADLVELTHELDPSRPAMVGGAQRGDVDKLGDIAGYNGDGARLFHNPGVPNMVTEYGAISKPHEAYDGFLGDVGNSWQFAVGSGQEKKIRESSHELSAHCPPPTTHFWRSGEAIWAGFDYGTIAGKQGLKGIVDHFRVPKRSWHWYREQLRGIAPPPEPIDAPPARMQIEADKEYFEADGTDDAQITVTLLDEVGRHVRATPPVTLRIEFGPGEFPTGRSITFEADTDIAITLGRCAIALRAYEAGPIVVRATSPGLPDASITLESIGPHDAFLPGETELVADRPYTPPPPSEAALAAMRNAVDVALNRPSRASSEKSGCPARSANDGRSDTWWTARDDDAAPWFTVDLEGFYELSSGSTTFAEGGVRYAVDLSRDGQTWTRAIDKFGLNNPSATRQDVYDPGTVARYVRLTFAVGSSTPRPRIRDFKLFGLLHVR
jgi:hypothetical protein